MDASLRIQLCFHFKFKTLIYFGGFKFHPSQLLISMSELNRQYKPHTWMEGDSGLRSGMPQCAQWGAQRKTIRGLVLENIHTSFLCMLRVSASEFWSYDRQRLNFCIQISFLLIYTLPEQHEDPLFLSTVRCTYMQVHLRVLEQFWGHISFWTVFMAMPNVKGNFSHHGA